MDEYLSLGEKMHNESVVLFIYMLVASKVLVGGCLFVPGYPDSK